MEGENWLPAYVVFGEGIFLELDEEQLRSWRASWIDPLEGRIGRLVKHFEQVRVNRRLQERPLSVRFVKSALQEVRDAQQVEEQELVRERVQNG